ncbi:MAG TPA: endonuclease/exonuclease/phosphatase family protein [Vicinamibacterales bacterium]|nr:endonuclease/exonuclease/phosphatase family protein [Vicinamibacterales bacterium]
MLVSLAAAGCTGGYNLVRRDTAGLGSSAWLSPALASDRAALERWSSAVGPPVLARHARAAVSASDTLVVASWNTALGHGDVDALFADLRREYPASPIVLLLQEVYRGGPEVPAVLEPAAVVAKRLGGRGDRPAREVEAAAARLELDLYYVPSMRNGPPPASDEDRGNAILSTLPLQDLTAIELPFERQRRVAVAATIGFTSSNGMPWTLRVASAHLDNMVGPKRLWFAGGELARTRQARALKESLSDAAAAVLGGDFNTWFGFSDRAYGELARAFPDTRVTDRRPTFLGVLRLDHLFFRVPDGWQVDFRRLGDRYGSDHSPLVAAIRLPIHPAPGPE